ncbi:MAG: S-methyl-5'-thioadenosine phosphorylase [SAR202 cluster bacterium]|nr:S-methyl-5'-thioadenosine phosphorylase [SAR202 cluster bacterium]
MAEAKLGIIGGSGHYDLEGLTGKREVEVNTPFGPPSDSIVLGTLSGVRLAFLPRHGRGHRIDSSEIPARANIYALKSLGVERIISVNAVGSLQEDMRPLDMVVPDQIIDRTSHRASTFFGKGIVGHIAFADPYCPELRSALIETATRHQPRTHVTGTMVVMEGPAFSTRAESNLYRSWGAHIIGMTALPEAKLAREAEICYATLAQVTDYDCWHHSEESVSVELVVANLRRNVETSRRILKDLVSAIPTGRGCGCGSALQNAIITAPDTIPVHVKERLSLIIGKYVPVTSEVR